MRTKAASITPSDDYLDGKGVDANYAAHDWLNTSEKRKKNILLVSSDEDADDDMYQLTKEDESLNEEMWLEIMEILATFGTCLLYTSPSPRDRQKSRMPSSA